jgi:hypothetical protein
MARGLWANIHAKRKKGAPTNKAIKKSQNKKKK